MFQSIIVYTLVLVIMVFFGIITLQKESITMSVNGQIKPGSIWRFDTIFPLLLFAIIFGMRYDVGVDHLSYLEGYIQHEYVGKQELLFNLLSDISWKFNLHYVLYFSIIAFIQVFFFYYAFNKEKYLYPFLTFFLFTNGTLFFWMNGIRQALAMCIWIFSLKYIIDKKIWKYVLCCIIAFLFHRSAIILIVFYPILRNGRDYFKSIQLQLLVFAGAFAFSLLFESFILHIAPLITSYASITGGDYYGSYDVEALMNSFKEPEGTGLAYLFEIIMNISVILNSKKLKTFYDSKNFNIVYFFFFLGTITMYIFPVGVIAIRRPFSYLYIFMTIMYAYYLYYLYKTKLKNYPLGTFHAIKYYGIITIYLSIFYLSLITSNENAHLWYQFFFQRNINGFPIK